MIDGDDESYKFSSEINSNAIAVKKALLTCLLDKNDEIAKASFKFALKNRPPVNSKKDEAWSYWIFSNIRGMYLLDEDFEYVFKLTTHNFSTSKDDMYSFLHANLSLVHQSYRLDAKWKGVMQDYYRLMLKITHIQQLEMKLCDPDDWTSNILLTTHTLDLGIYGFISTIDDDGNLSGIGYLKGAIDSVSASLNKPNYPQANEHRIKLLDFFEDVDSLPYSKSVESIDPLEIVSGIG